MERRKFIQTAGYSAAAAFIPPHLAGSNPVSQANVHQVKSADKQASVLVKENTVTIETHTLSATIQKGIITSLKSKSSGEEFIEKPDINNFRALQLLYIRNEVCMRPPAG